MFLAHENCGGSAFFARNLSVQNIGKFKVQEAPKSPTKMATQAM